MYCCKYLIMQVLASGLEDIVLLRVCTWYVPVSIIPPLTLDYIIGCIISGRSNACNHVSNSEEMFGIFNFFCKQVGKIDIASNMVDRYGLILN